LRPPNSSQADIHMAIYNGDGSQVGACGNATRCVARLMFEELDCKKAVIETISGLLPTWEDPSGLIAVDFGRPRLEWGDIPLAHKVDTLNVPIPTDDQTEACCVNMGNPHAVFFVSDIDKIALEKIGPRLEHDPIFPERCNIEIAQIISSDRIRMRVWERGAGITEACGSGACATLVAAVRRKLSARRATLILDGGELIIEWREDNHVLMVGPASYSFSGDVAKNLGSNA